MTDPKPVTLERAEQYLDGSKQCRPACDLAWRRVDEAADDYDVLLENYRDTCQMLVQVCRERDELMTDARAAVYEAYEVQS